LFKANLGLLGQAKEFLAQQLFEQKDFEKAILIYEELFETNSQNSVVYNNYLVSLIQLNQHKKALKIIQKSSKKVPNPLPFMIDQCWVLSQMPEENKEFEKLLNFITLKTTQNPNMAFQAAQRFKFRNMLNVAIDILQKTEQIYGEDPQISNEIALIYLENGQRFKALERYIDLMVRSNVKYDQLKQIFDVYVTDSADIVALQEMLLLKVQQYPTVTSLSEWLKWTFISLQNWEKAYIYTRSLDKRLQEEGERMMELGELCYTNKAFSTASRCYRYIIDKGADNYYYELALAKWQHLTFIDLQSQDQQQLSIQDSINLSQSWQTYFQDLRKFIWEFGPSNTTLTNASNLAWIWAQKYQNIDSAASILQSYVEAPYLNKKIVAEAKISLGDLFAESGRTYKSELLYAQVEKAFTEDEMGQLAKFKRAELSFYRGDFDWANMQLDVLKGATTRLISNNAMELSLCITDNLGVDSNFTALEYYGKALLFQRQKINDSALLYLNKITIEFPGHSLGDEVLMRKAQIEKSRKNYERAAQIFDVLIAAYPDDILHDNALFEAAQLHQYQMNNTSKALELYQALIDKHTNSIFIVDARKEYRKLRGF